MASCAALPRWSGETDDAVLASTAVERQCVYAARQLNVQQTIEEGAVAAQGYTQIFGGDVVATAPLTFQFAPLLRKSFRQPFAKMLQSLLPLQSHEG